VNLCQALQDVNADALMLAYHLEILFINRWYPSALAPSSGDGSWQFLQFWFCYGLFEAMCKKGSDPSMCYVHYSIVAGGRKRLS